MIDFKERAKRLKSQIPAIFIALKEEDTPILAKLFAGLTVIYALSPIDLIPDFIPVLGYLDDLLILPSLAALTIRCIPHEIWERSMRKADDMWDGVMQQKWYYAVPMVVFWVMVLGLIVKVVWF